MWQATAGREGRAKIGEREMTVGNLFVRYAKPDPRECQGAAGAARCPPAQPVPLPAPRAGMRETQSSMLVRLLLFLLAPLVEPLLVQVLRKQVRYLKVVQVREREMSVSG